MNPNWTPHVGNPFQNTLSKHPFGHWTPVSGKSKRGLWHLLTNCYAPPGTVGLAYLGTLCNTGGYNTGVDHAVSATGWKTTAHEVGHNFGGAHSFEEGQVRY